MAPIGSFLGKLESMSQNALTCIAACLENLLKYLQTDNP